MGKHKITEMFFSPSGLKAIADCARCGFLEYHAFHDIQPCPKPRGIFPTLPNGIDKVVKSYHNVYRKIEKLPPYLAQHVAGILHPDFAFVKRLQNWRSGPTVTLPYKKNGTVSLRGALDELILREDQKVSPLDSKSKGFPPKDDGSQYYQLQLDCYDFMLQESLSMQTTGTSYLAYVWPRVMRTDEDPLGIGLIVDFDSQVFALKTEAQRAKDALLDAADLIAAGDLPDSSPTCEQCTYKDFREQTERDIANATMKKAEGLAKTLKDDERVYIDDLMP